MLGIILLMSFLPSILPSSICPGIFLEWYYFFLNFGLVLGTYTKLCVTAGFSGKILFAPKMGKMGQKQGFLNLLKNLVINFYWIYSIMKIYIICCVPAQIPYLGKFLFVRYRSKCSQANQIAGFFNQVYLLNEIMK